jgi:Domain of unknown function (DUF1707)
MAWPGEARAVAASGCGHMLASHADRERVLDTLAAAFAAGRLTKDDFDARVARTLASRTYADLATVTTGIPAGPPGAQPPLSRPGSRRRVNGAVRWGISGLITPTVAAAGFVLAAAPGDGRLAAVAFVIAFVYFVSWLSAGADMLWQWYSMALPTARMCVRCAHTAASHRTPGSCGVPRGSVTMWRRCTCAGYVPPGLSPRIADQRLSGSRV